MRRAFFLLLAMALLPGMQTFAQAAPRTPDNRPDFSGVWATRFPPFLFQRARGASALVVDDKEAHRLATEIYQSGQSGVQDPGDELATIYALPRVRGEWRTSMLIDPPDGLSPLTEEAKRLASAQSAGFRTHVAGPEGREWSDRCLGATGRAPFGNLPTENLRDFVQTADHLVVYSEDQGDTRIIGIGAKPRPAAIISFVGDSVAHWEGETLVVVTRGIRGEQPARKLLPGLMVGEKSVVTEQFSLIGPNDLLYEFSVDDPTYYTQPWKAEYTMNRKGVRTYEHACHEGDYSLENILRIARHNDAVAKP